MTNEVRQALAEQADVVINWDLHPLRSVDFDCHRTKAALVVENEPLGATVKKFIDTFADVEKPMVFVTWRLPNDRVELLITSRAEAERNFWTLPGVYR